MHLEVDLALGLQSARGLVCVVHESIIQVGLREEVIIILAEDVVPVSFAYALIASLDIAARPIAQHHVCPVPEGQYIIFGEAVLAGHDKRIRRNARVLQLRRGLP